MIAPRGSFLRWLAFVAIAAAGVHVAAVAALPNFLMSRAIARVSARYGTNAMGFPPLATESARTIVQPSPDLLYSTCAFDLTKHALHIRTAIPSDGYWSLALYGANTDAFHVTDNRQAAAKFEALLVGPRTAPPDANGMAVVQAPSTTGILLIRRLIASPEAVPAEDAARRTAVCEAAE